MNPHTLMQLSALLMCAAWVVAWVKPNWLSTSMLGVSEKGTEQSRWMRGKLRALALKAYRYTGWLPIAIVSWLPMDWYAIGLIAFGVVQLPLFALYKRRLKRQWMLWQQLGYDGPPDVAAQAAQLAQPTQLH